MVFDRKLGKYVAKQLDMQIAEDAENYRIISPPGVRTLKYFSKTSVQGTRVPLYAARHGD